MDKGRGRRWIAEGKSLRGENEMEWDSDGDGEMDTESKTMLQRKFAGSERRKEGGGEGDDRRSDEQTHGDMFQSRDGDIRQRLQMTPSSSPLISVSTHTFRSISVQNGQM